MDDATRMADIGDLTDSQGDNYFILDYAKENCSNYTTTKKGYTTCIVYKTELIPSDYYIYENNEYKLIDNVSNEAIDFYYCDSLKRFSNSLKAFGCASPDGKTTLWCVDSV